MNKRMPIIAAWIMAICSSTAVSASTCPPYDATYTSYGAPNMCTKRIISDGNGREWTEVTASGRKILSIHDYQALTSISFIGSQKLAIQVPTIGAPRIVDAESAMKFKAKPLGTKVINGHPCHGWEYKAFGEMNQAWIGDDIKCLVKSATVTQNGIVGMELTSYKSAKPSPSQFAVPPGYKLVRKPGS